MSNGNGKRLCSECGKRPARFRYRGRVKRDSDHDLCMQCFREAEEANKQNQERK